MKTMTNARMPHVRGRARLVWIDVGRAHALCAFRVLRTDLEEREHTSRPRARHGAARGARAS